MNYKNGLEKMKWAIYIDSLLKFLKCLKNHKKTAVKNFFLFFSKKLIFQGGFKFRLVNFGCSQERITFLAT